LAPDRAASPKTQKSPTLDAQAPKSEAHSGPVLEILSQTPIEIDELIRRTGRSTAEIMAELLELEMTGRLVRHPGQKVSLG
jgi:DNA processing protein